MTIPAGERPRTRRELRERERRLADVTMLPEQRSAPSSAVGVAGPASSTPGSSPEAPGEAPSSGTVTGDELAPHDPHRYTWKHYLALAVVGAVFGSLVWSLTTSTDQHGALGGVPTDPTTSLPAQPAAARGEL